MTIVEKILARASGADSVAPGDLVIANVDVAMLTDMTFETWSHDVLAVWDARKVIVVFDHNHASSPPPYRRGDVADARSCGALASNAFTTSASRRALPTRSLPSTPIPCPGRCWSAGDPHTSGGALDQICAAFPVPMLMAVGDGYDDRNLLGATVRYDLTGTIEAGVSAKDVFLHLAQTYGDHANQNVEFGGPGLAGLSINARQTLATMGAELSAEFVVFEPDALLVAYLHERTTAASPAGSGLRCRIRRTPHHRPQCVVQPSRRAA